MHAYKTLLGNKLDETAGRSTYSGTEVRDMLLDLWNAINLDEEEVAGELANV